MSSLPTSGLGDYDHDDAGYDIYRLHDQDEWTYRRTRRHEPRPYNGEDPEGEYERRHPIDEDWEPDL